MADNPNAKAKSASQSAESEVSGIGGGVRSVFMDSHEDHVAHAPHTGNKYFDYTVAVSALFISGVSLWVAVHHGQIMRDLVVANSYPDVEYRPVVTLGKNGVGANLVLELQNAGTGPARIKTIELWGENKKIADRRSLTNLLTISSRSLARSAHIGGGSVMGSLIKPSGAKVLYAVNAKEGNVEALAKFAQKIDVRVCYCSVFDGCYIKDTRKYPIEIMEAESCSASSDVFDDRYGS